MAAQQASKRKKYIHRGCKNADRNMTVRQRLRNKLKYAEEIKKKKTTK